MPAVGLLALLVLGFGIFAFVHFFDQSRPLTAVTEEATSAEGEPGGEREANADSWVNDLGLLTPTNLLSRESAPWVWAPTLT